MKIAKETWIIAMIGLADLATTLIWVSFHGAHEANPLFAHYLAMGAGWFIFMKIVLLAAPLLLLEWARGRQPVFTRNAARFVIVSYLAMYGVGVTRLNPHLLPGGESSNMAAQAPRPVPPDIVYARIRDLQIEMAPSSHARRGTKITSIN